MILYLQHLSLFLIHSNQSPAVMTCVFLIVCFLNSQKLQNVYQQYHHTYDLFQFTADFIFTCVF